MDEREKPKESGTVLREPSTQELARLLEAGEETAAYYIRDRQRLEQRIVRLSMIAKRGRIV